MLGLPTTILDDCQPRMTLRSEVQLLVKGSGCLQLVSSLLPLANELSRGILGWA
jgi:hypothetical protein